MFLLNDLGNSNVDFHFFIFFKKRLQTICHKKRDKLINVGWTFHDSNGSQSVKWVRRHQNINEYHFIDMSIDLILGLLSHYFLSNRLGYA